MRSRLFRGIALSYALAVAALLLSAGATSAQRPSTPLAPVATELNSLLRHGLDLERQRQWDKALEHYDEARKRFPTDVELERRFQLARMHYDVARRYNDSSFRALTADLSLQKALALYDEVLVKVETHYVDQPRWKQLVDHGTEALDVALTEESFGSRNIPGVPSERVEAFRTELRRTMDPAKIDSRRDAVGAVHWAAYEAARQLGMPAGAAVLEYVCGAANSLDDYSAFLSGGELKEVYAQIQGNFVGLGVELKGTKRGLLVMRVIKGSPAEAAGVRQGDVILAVDGKSTVDTTADKAADMLQGPEHSRVTVTVESAGQRRDLVVTRRRVEVPSVEEAKILDAAAGIAYFRITSFQESTDKEVYQTLWKLHRQGMKSLIVDVRGNPGGLLRSAVDVVDRFVSRGTIVSTRGRNELENQTYRAQTAEDQTWHVPMVVLIDGDSASASEIFAGAIRDHQRGTLVGRRTYGKGSVQGIFSLKTVDTGIRLTTAKFYSPHGKPFSKVGVDPHVEVRQTAKPTDEAVFVATADDPDVAAALSVARDNMARRGSPGR